MPRNLDLTALRAFATVASTGGVTRVAALLNVTQSAFLMQVKRLEEALDATLPERTGRAMRLTPDAETGRDPVRDRLPELMRQSYGSLRGSRRPSRSIVSS